MISQLKRYCVYALLAGGVFSSCNNDNEALLSGEGKLMMRAIIETPSESRSIDAKELSDSCEIYLFNDKGIIRKYKGIDNLPAEEWLKTGEYRVEAWSGDSVPASFDAIYYKGQQSFVINKGETTTVELTCGIANVVASVQYDAEVTDALKDYSIVVGHTRGSLTFNGDDTRKGYFMMPLNVSQLSWTLNATTFDGKPFTKKGIIPNVKGGTEYSINIKYTGNLPEEGGAQIIVTVDEAVVDVEHNVSINNAPSILGVDFDIAQTQEFTKGEVGRKAIVVTSPVELSQVTMACDSLVELGFDALSYELLPIADEQADYLLHKGINYVYKTYDDGSSNFVLNISAKLCNLLPAGEYPIVITAVDKDGLSRSETLDLIIKPIEVVE